MKQLVVLTEISGIYPMGLTVAKDRFHISVAWAGDTCSLLLFEKGQESPWQKVEFRKGDRQGDVWNLSFKLTGVRAADLEYALELDGEQMPDPYGKAMTGWEEWGDLENIHKNLRSPLAVKAFDWEDDKLPGIPFEDMVIYRMHVRGWTKHSSSKVRNKGTFKAITEKIPYLKELGITTVELMPVTEFKEVLTQGGKDGNPYGKMAATGQINYWGYGESYGFAPKAAYSSGREKHPVQEFKTLVKELHKAGIEVVAELYFTGKESPSYVLDVVRFWVQEYHLDGVHLVGFVQANLIGQDPYLSKTKLFATSWDGVEKGKEKHLAEYNDGFMVDMRKILKGDEDQINQLIFRSRQNPKDCGVINYMASSNGFTMMDMVSYDRKHNEANGEQNQDGNDYNFSWNCGVEGPTKKKKVTALRKKQLRNAMLLLFLSQGTPLLMAGDEFGNSKGGNNNSYCQDNEISWINWNQQRTNHELLEFVRKAIAFRRSHPVLHMKNEPRNMDYLACGCPDVSYHGVKPWYPEFENFRRELGILYCGKYGKKADGSQDNTIYVIYNMHWEPHEFDLPNPSKGYAWHMAIDTDSQEVNGFYEEGAEPLLKEQKKLAVAGRSIVVLIAKEKAAQTGKGNAAQAGKEPADLSGKERMKHEKV